VTPGATPVTRPLAPMMPATCVPWPLQSSGIGSGFGSAERGARRVGVVGVADEIETSGDPLAGPEPGAEIRMLQIDAGVHHRHADAPARQAELVLRDVRPGHLDGGREVGRHAGGAGHRVDLHRVDGLDRRELADLVDGRRLRLDRDAVPERLEPHPLLERHAFRPGLSAERLVVASHGRVVVRVGERALGYSTNQNFGVSLVITPVSADATASRVCSSSAAAPGRDAARRRRALRAAKRELWTSDHFHSVYCV